MNKLRKLSRVAAALRIGAVPAVARRMHAITFSQYAEDLVLYHFYPRATGFYVDVGAYDPIEMSNTYRLYLKGWRGLTIEPNPEKSTRFQRLRPEDTHLTIGISLEPGTLVYHRFSNPSENTFDPAAASQKATRLTSVGDVEIECLQLAAVVDRYAAGRAIDFLNVDCEGHDLAVLRSLDWNRHRPTVISVEDFEEFDAAVAPARSPSEIRAFLTEQGYALASQLIFSFIYVDRQALRKNRDSGFDLSRSQLYGLLTT